MGHIKSRGGGWGGGGEGEAEEEEDKNKKNNANSTKAFSLPSAVVIDSIPENFLM